VRGADSASIFQNFDLDSINGQKEIAAGYSYSRDVFSKGGSCKERQRETDATDRDEDDEDDEDLEEAYYGPIRHVLESHGFAAWPGLNPAD